MDLLARREPFGYLFMDRDTEEIFVVRTSEDIDFSALSRIEVPAPDGTIRAPDRLFLRPSRPQRQGILVGPTTVEFYPTATCNERCPDFCYFGDRLGSGKVYPRDHIPILIDNLVRAGVFQFVILGGEPFLYPHLPLLLDSAGTHKFVISLSTNGTIRRPDVLERIATWGVHFQVSFHSHLPTLQDNIVGRRGAYECALGTIRFLCQAGTPPHISIVATRANAATIPDTIGFLHDIGIKSISLFHTQNTGYAVTSGNRLLDFRSFALLTQEATRRANLYSLRLLATTNYPFLLPDAVKFSTLNGLEDMLYGHHDGRRMLYILNNGSILGTFYRALDSDCVLGNVVTDDVGTLWRTSPSLDSLRHLNAHGACIKCEHFSYCRGGTPGIRSKYFISLSAPNCPVFNPFVSAE